MEDNHHVKEGDGASAGGEIGALVDPAGLANGNAPVDEPTDKAADDVGREDTFVDCPDEIETSESLQNPEDKDNLKDDQYNESDSGVKVQHLMDEIERLRDKQEMTVGEKEWSARQYEEERAVVKRELTNLCYQLRVLNMQQTSSGENADVSLDHLQTASLHEIISECFMFVKTASDEHFQTEGKFTELQSLLYMKDQEIEFLNAKVAELSASYSYFLSETDQLRKCLTEVGLDINIIDGNGVFAVAQDKIIEFSKKEEIFYQNLSNVEDESRKLVEQLEKQRSIIENANTEIGKLTAEAEREKHRYENTKEKLSMAVTKGKALVQQRDSLKQSLAEKTSELEKCSRELQEKSSALEIAEQTKDLVAASEKLSASLQESLAEKDIMLQKCGEILSEFVPVEEWQPMDISEKLRSLADENKSLKTISMQYNKLIDALTSFDFPEAVLSSELDARVRWLAESFFLSQEETVKLQSEIAQAKEAADKEIEMLTASFLAETQEKTYLEAALEDLRNKYEADGRLQHELVEAREALNSEIDHLTTSLLAETQEKNYLQSELENLRDKYEVSTQNEHRISVEKDKIVYMLLEASSSDGAQGIRPENSNMATIIDTCLAKIKEQAGHLESSKADMEIFESLRSLFYIRDLEMTLYKLIVEEDMSDRAEINHLSSELEMMTQQLDALKDEKAVMQKSIEQLEDRCGLLKEKLSMAVKKGKGLVQERENLKGALSEKNSEIDKLKSELQQSLSTYNECQDQITKLSLDVEQISQLETDLVATKEHAVQLEQFLAESNNILQRIMESIEGVTTPADLVFKEPVEKIKWLAGYLSEHESAKVGLEQELIKVKDDASSLASQLSEVQTMKKSLEDALLTAENKISRLLDEKKELEVSKTLIEEELQKEKQEASSHINKFEEVAAGKRGLEDALSLAENNISRFKNERDIAEENQALAEEQLQKLKEEFSNYIIKLADAEKTIQSLEDSLSEAQKNVSLLAEENSKVQVAKDDLESEMKKLREEADSQAIKLSDVSLTTKSLEDALANAENRMVTLVQEKKNAEEEILTLSSKLESCMNELAGTCGSMDTRSIELSGQLIRLQSLLKDETLSTMLGQCFDKKFESLNNMNILLKEMENCFLEMDSQVLQNNPVLEDESSMSTTLPSIHHTASDIQMLNDEVNAVDSESIMSHIEKMNERFHLRGKILADKLDNLSTHMDESITALLRRIHLTKDRVVSILRCAKSLKEQVKDMETDNQRQEDAIALLESDIRILLSACADATKGLEVNFHEKMSALESTHELIKTDGTMAMDFGAVGGDAAATFSTDHVKTAEKLLHATRRNQDLSKLYQDAINKLTGSVENLQNKWNESQLNYDEVSEERDLLKDKVLKLETDLEAQQQSLNGMTRKLDDYQEKDVEWREKEEELSAALSKVQEFEDSPLSAPQLKSILDKMNEIEVLDAALTAGDGHDSDDVRKLFYVIDSFNGLVQKVTSLSHEKEELQSTIDEQILEIEHLSKQVENHLDKDQDSEMMEILVKLGSSLHNIVRKLGDGDLMDGYEDAGAVQLLPLLDKLVVATINESESLKSKNEELVAKLLGAQRTVEDLSNKVKVLEESNQPRIVPSEMNQERGTSVASSSTQSDISEIQDMAAIGKNTNVPLVPSAAHPRTLRKGSSDHLAINVGSESERLINNKESDEDKGHMFKSLNTSGLVPRQGRMVADRIDGFWVSGSRALMSHPRGRLGVFAYWLVLHLWLLGTIF